jgi:hypothetical protein
MFAYPVHSEEEKDGQRKIAQVKHSELEGLQVNIRMGCTASTSYKVMPWPLAGKPEPSENWSKGMHSSGSGSGFTRQ